jgi:hypothetical protein
LLTNGVERLEWVGLRGASADSQFIEFRNFEIKLSGRGPGIAFIDAGDQLIALSKGERERPDGHPSGWWWTTSGP